MPYEFESNLEKANSNLSKHKVSFEEAVTVFDDPFALIEPDIEHSLGEERGRVVGFSHKARVLVVSYTERGDRVRIISARQATKKERRGYANAER